MKSRRCLGELCVALVAIATATAYPDLYYSSTCTSHPTGSMRPHGAPSTDSSIAFTVKSTANAVVSSLCAGSVYAVTVSYPQTRETLLTASLGSLGGSSSCPNKRLYTGDANSHSASLTIPCSVNGATSVTLKVTTATSRWGSFLQASTTLPISSSCGCASSSPPPAAAASSLSPTPSPSTSSGTSPAAAASPSPSPSPSPVATDSSSDSGSSDSSSGSDSTGSDSTSGAVTCATSSLGYACALTLPGGGGETLHWTAGTAAPPDNACTSTTGTASGTSSYSGAANLVHFALSSPQAGYLSVGFTERAGMMAPANAVIGRISSGSAIVETYYMTSYNLDSPSNNGWAAGAAVLSTSAGGTVLCFSVAADGAAAAAAATVAAGRRRRQLATAGTAASAPRRSLAASTTTTTTSTTTSTTATTNALGLDASALEIIWATHSSVDLTATHNRWGGVSLNALSGAAAATAANKRRDQMLALHGGLAAAGWVLLVPLGLLLARHRRDISALRKAPRACGRDMWLVLHVGCVVVGTACGAASIGVAVAELRGSGARDPNTRAHRITGWAVLALAVLQMLSGGVRPDPGAPRRRLWTFLHANLGRVAALLAWACTGLGVFLAVTRYSQDLTVWAAPLAATLALLLGAELGLTAAAALVSEAAYAAAPPPGPNPLLLTPPSGGPLLFPPPAAHGGQGGYGGYGSYGGGTDGVCVGYPATVATGALPTSQRAQSQQQGQRQQQQQHQGVYVLPAGGAGAATAPANQLQSVYSNGGSSRHQLYQPFQQPYQPSAALPTVTATGASAGATADATAARPPSSRQARPASRPPSAGAAAAAATAGSTSNGSSGGGVGDGSVPPAPMRRQPSPPSLDDSGYGDGALGLRAAPANKKYGS